MAKVCAKYNGDGLQVVAHGDGGLLAFAALTPETKHMFESCIFIGCAARPAALLLRFPRADCALPLTSGLGSARR